MVRPKKEQRFTAHELAAELLIGVQSMQKWLQDLEQLKMVKQETNPDDLREWVWEPKFTIEPRKASLEADQKST